MALVILGIVMLVLGIVYHVQFMVGLRKQRKRMMADGLIHGESVFPPSLTLVTALILLLIDRPGRRSSSMVFRHRAVLSRPDRPFTVSTRRSDIMAKGKPSNRTSSSSGATTSASRT